MSPLPLLGIDKYRERRRRRRRRRRNELVSAVTTVKLACKTAKNARGKYLHSKHLPATVPFVSTLNYSAFFTKSEK